jgi:hypothetical protein
MLASREPPTTAILLQERQLTSVRDQLAEAHG